MLAQDNWLVPLGEQTYDGIDVDTLKRERVEDFESQPDLDYRLHGQKYAKYNLDPAEILKKLQAQNSVDLIEFVRGMQDQYLEQLAIAPPIRWGSEF